MQNHTETKLPVVLFERTLEWERDSSRRYRMVATESEFGFSGVTYITEKYVGCDAMGVERWEETAVTEGSLLMATIGQEMLSRLGAK